jgi:hypothetical protein
LFVEGEARESREGELEDEGQRPGREKRAAAGLQGERGEDREEENANGQPFEEERQTRNGKARRRCVGHGLEDEAGKTRYGFTRRLGHEPGDLTPGEGNHLEGRQPLRSGQAEADEDGEGGRPP